MLSYSFAQRTLLRNLPALKERRMELSRSLRHVLAVDVFASCDSPPFNRATMDGFALRCRKKGPDSLVLKVNGFIPAGKKIDKKFREDECAAIATGAVVPACFNAIVRKEDARLLGGSRVRFLKKPALNQFICLQGSECQRGELLLKRGDLLTPVRLALLASQGYRSIKVIARPRVSLLVTGDEIIESSAHVGCGFVRNATRPMMESFFKEEGFEHRYLGVAPDRLEPLIKKIKRGLEDDCLIITGAVSAGDRDLVATALKKCGARIIFHGVRVKPGKPLLFARKGSTVIFGLAGNPVSSLTGFLFFAHPALERLSGLSGKLRKRKGILTKDVYNREDRLLLAPARARLESGRLMIEPLVFRGSADLCAVGRAHGFFSLSAQTRLASKGVSVDWYPFLICEG